MPPILIRVPDGLYGRGAAHRKTPLVITSGRGNVEIFFASSSQLFDVNILSFKLIRLVPRK